MQQEAAIAGERIWNGDADLLECAERLLGIAARDAIWRAFSGRKIYIPKQVTTDHPIALAVGVGGMRLIVEELGGIMLTLPAFPESAARGRRERVCAMRQAGMPAYIIAAEIGLTERRVFQVIADLRANGELPPRRNHQRKES